MAITVGIMVALYFRDNCLGCTTEIIRFAYVSGFVPPFLWTYGVVSLTQVEIDKTPSPAWYYLLAVPIVIGIPYIVGVSLETFFGI